MLVILDTNFLIYCAKNKLDYEEEIGDILNEKFELVVPEQVVKELNSLMNDSKKKVSGKDKDACNLALQIIEKKGVRIVKPEGKDTDRALIKLSKKDKKNIIATLDREMRKKLPRVILISRGNKLLLTR